MSLLRTHMTKAARWATSVVSVVVMVMAVLVGVGIQQAAATPSCHPFPDVTSSNPHCENIEWLSGQGITKPTGGKYHPAAKVTRGSMAAFLFRLTNPGKPSPKCTSKPYPDVSTSNVFCGYIQWAVKGGVAKGYPNGTFRPDNGVTRGAMAAFLQRIAKPGQPAKKCTSKPFTDVKVKDTFCAVITWMADNGVTYGVGGGKNYGTKQIVNRQSMASFLHRLDNLMKGKGSPGKARTFGNGTFKVGTKIRAGTYRMAPAKYLCNWARQSGPSNQFRDVIENSTRPGPAVVTIKKSDAYFRSEGCSKWTSDLSRITKSQTSGIGDGTWIVGTDLKPGTWKASGGTNCTWARLSGFADIDYAVIESNRTQGAGYDRVNIATSDKGFLTYHCGTWKRTG